MGTVLSGMMEAVRRLRVSVGPYKLVYWTEMTVHIGT